MEKFLKNKKGITIMELLVYLGISAIVVSATTSFLVQTTKNRIDLNNQREAQYAARVVTEKMTYSLRNAYDLTVLNGGTEIDIYSVNEENTLLPPLITKYLYQDGRIYYGQSAMDTFTPEDLMPLTEEDIYVESVDFEKVSSSLMVSLDVDKHGQKSNINSTISFRQ